MSRHPRLYRVYQYIDVVERTAPVCRLLETTQRVLVSLRRYLYISLVLFSLLYVCLQLSPDVGAFLVQSEFVSSLFRDRFSSAA